MIFNNVLSAKVKNQELNLILRYMVNIKTYSDLRENMKFTYIIIFGKKSMQNKKYLD